MSKKIKISSLLLSFTSILFSCGSTSSSLESISTSSTSTSESTSSTSSDGFEIDPNDDGSATIRIYKNNQSKSTQRFIPPSKVNMQYSFNSLSGILSNNENVCPSIGNVNLLVIPVHLPNGDEYKTEAIRSDIEKMFFSSSDSRLGYKSIKDYYYESSYGKLNFQGKVTDWFDATSIKDDSGNQLITSDLDITQGTSGTIIKILQAATSWAIETQGINIKDYDQNNDGSIDGIWLVYDHLDWSTQSLIEIEKDPSYDTSKLNSSFWNFTGWDTTTSPDLDNPTTSAFSWASFDMMYTSYCDLNSNDVPQLNDLTSIPLDSHTFIHETGHLLGLNDYYSSSDSYYHPAGKFTMMDQNVGDLDSYSKMLLGWVTPYVVYGTSEIVIPTVSSSDHAVIVIPTNYDEISSEIEGYINRGAIDYYTYDFNPFSEYLMIDLYSPTGLNENDVYGPIINDREEGMTATGVRIYHIDGRIFKCNVVEYDGGTKLNYVDGYVWDGDLNNFERNQAILMPISNDKIESSTFGLPSSFDSYDEIRLLEATGINTFDNNYYSSNSTLWNLDSSPFDINTFGYQFFNGNYCFNDGEDIPFLIEVETLKGVGL